MNITRDKAREIADQIYDAGFNMYGVGNYDVNREEFCNILMIALTKKDREQHLHRYYEILYAKMIPSRNMNNRGKNGKR